MPALWRCAIAVYPSSIWPGNTRGSLLSDAETHTTWHDEAMDEIIAVQTELGTAPSGASATVAARLDLADDYRDAICIMARGNQVIPDASNTIVDWVNEGSTRLDPRDWFDAGTSTSQIVPDIAGWYEVGYVVTWSADGDYVRTQVALLLNGVQATDPTTPAVVYADERYASTVGRRQAGTFPPIFLNGTTDDLQLLVFQDNTSGNNNNAASLMSVKLVYPT